MNANDLPSLDGQLFEWKDWYEEGPLSMQFVDVTLKVQVGDFPAGTRLPAAFIMGEQSLLVLIDDEHEEHGFRLNVSVGEKVEPPTEQCGEGCCHHH